MRLGIIRAESRNKQLVKKHNLPDWDRKGLVLGKIHHTSVIEKNLDPEWNERKELYANIKHSCNIIYIQRSIVIIIMILDMLDHRGGIKPTC